MKVNFMEWEVVWTQTAINEAMEENLVLEKCPVVTIIEEETMVLIIIKVQVKEQDCLGWSSMFGTMAKIVETIPNFEKCSVNLY